MRTLVKYILIMRIFLVFIVIICIEKSVLAQKEWYLNFSPGLSYAFPAPLIINQEGYPNISFWATYKTEPLILPPYYSYRAGFFNDGKGWELEMNHLKVILKNNPEEIQQFSITHGYNQIFVSRAIQKPDFGIKYGVGVVLAHPENIVRNLHFDENKGIFGSGYYLRGPAIQAGLFKEIFITRRFILLIETKISLAYTNVPVTGGKAHAPILAFHLQLGPGFYFIKKERQN